MIRRVRMFGATVVVLASAALLPTMSASAATIYQVRATLSTSLSASLPLLRLHFSVPTKAKSLPPLVTKPALSTKWQQISPDDVQAISLSKLRPLTTYQFQTPTGVSCTKVCSFTTFTTSVVSVTTNLTWEAQLLSELNYLPLTFTPGTPQSGPSDEVNGTFTWTYPNLPTDLTSQWSVGTDNVILSGALRTFQSQHNLPVTGIADPTTWNELVNAANSNDVDPATYNYVDVSETDPETLTLYVAGKVKFTTLVNTGIEPVPTETGTYPVYERFISTTMTGTN
ncbi:MAG TPA: L,D-transpeptidase family protein, partial [Acidimicrobiales bacterium]